MSVQRIGSGRFRAQVWDPDKQTKVSVTKLLTPAELDELGAENGTFADRDNAVAARVLGKRRLKERRGTMTIAQWRDRWLADELFSGHWTQSTRIHRRERTSEFAEECGDLLVGQFDDTVWSKFLRGGRREGRRSGNRLGQIDAIRAMMNAAMTAEAGRMLLYNPAAHTKVKRSRGNKDKQPPTEEQMWNMLAIADELTAPSFRDYLALGCLTAMRPGELDGLTWEKVDRERQRIDVDQQWNAKERCFTLPKKGRHRIGIVGPADEVLRRALAYRQPDVPWVFPTLTGHHYTPSTRYVHWNKVRAAAGIGEKSLYLCTRHFFGWYGYVMLGLDSRVVGAQLGHKDGRLIEEVYGHRDIDKRVAELVAAFGALQLGPPSGDQPPVARPSLRLLTTEAAADRGNHEEQAA